MPRFKVKVLVQCAPPGVTPDAPNELVEMPRRVLFTPPPFLGEMLARSAQAIEAPDDALDEAAAAFEAARAVLPAGYSLDLVKMSFAHREVDGTYLATGGGGYVFIVGKAASTEIKPYTVRQRHFLRTAGSDAPEREVQVEFRCHLVVTAL